MKAEETEPMNKLLLVLIVDFVLTLIAVSARCDGNVRLMSPKVTERATR